MNSTQRMNSGPCKPSEKSSTTLIATLLRPAGNSARELSSARMADFSLPPSQAIPRSRRQPRGHQRGISEGGVRDWSAALGGLHLHGSRAPPTTPSHGQGGQQWGGGTGRR